MVWLDNALSLKTFPCFCNPQSNITKEKFTLFCRYTPREFIFTHTVIPTDFVEDFVVLENVNTAQPVLYNIYVYVCVCINISNQCGFSNVNFFYEILNLPWTLRNLYNDRFVFNNRYARISYLISIKSLSTNQKFFPENLQSNFFTK